MGKPWLTVGVVLALVASSAHASPCPTQTATLTPSKDNTLFQDVTGSTSNGAGEYLFAGLTATNSIRRALVAFDVAGSVPAGSTIVGATLTMNMSKTIVGPKSIELRRVSADWGEGASDAIGDEGMGDDAEPGDATWIHRYRPSSLWATPGGDFSGTLSATTSVGVEAPYSWTSPQLIADVQSMLDSPGGNFGWIVIGAETGAPTAKRFDSRENLPSVRPVLEIQYDRPGCPTTSTWGLLSGGFVVLTAATLAIRGRKLRGPALIS
ncbi:MAG: DNRLRE domain-containing protein [Phycisphaerales bacterium]|nr:DNRLRE domain-containing protein [Phycisphaerales bacterium]